LLPAVGRRGRDVDPIGLIGLGQIEIRAGRRGREEQPQQADRKRGLGAGAPPTCRPSERARVLPKTSQQTSILAVSGE
jgi:hypothetical protein